MADNSAKLVCQPMSLTTDENFRVSLKGGKKDVRVRIWHAKFSHPIVLVTPHDRRYIHADDTVPIAEKIFQRLLHCKEPFGYIEQTGQGAMSEFIVSSFMVRRHRWLMISKKSRVERMVVENLLGCKVE